MAPLDAVTPGPPPNDEVSGSTPTRGDSPPFDVAVKVVLEASRQANESALGVIKELPWRDALDLLAELREALNGYLGPLEASLVRHLYLTAPHGQTEIDGLGVIEVRRGNSRKNWDSRSGAHNYVQVCIEDTGGEYPDPATVVDWVLEVAGISYLRTTALRGHRLNPEDYCTTEPGKPTVTITRPGS